MLFSKLQTLSFKLFNWPSYDVITKNNGKIRTFAKPNELYSIRKFFIRAFQKCAFFIEFEPLCQKLWVFIINFGMFYNAHLPNMAMSRDPSRRF